MQLSNRPSGKIAAAALTLLGASTSAQPQTDDGKGWTFDSSTLFYAEGAGRVKVFEPKVQVGRGLNESSTINATVTVDVLSGATPNGASPYAQPQTFAQPHSVSSASGSSTPSGDTFYTVPAFKVPMDPNFHDLRGALDLDYSRKPFLHDQMNLSADVSAESDYTSLGGGLHWAHDFNDGNTTLGGGVHLSWDLVAPIGGVFAPLSQMVGSISNGPSSKTKLVQDAMIGVTQLLTPRSLLQFNYSLSHENGYLNDPYKILSVVRTDAAPEYYIYESRPGSRLRHALYLQYKVKAWGDDVLNLSYRYMLDDWGLHSHTADLGYRAYFPDSQKYLEPDLRLYRQNAADFYHPALDASTVAATQYASADQRLGAFTAYTSGLEYGAPLSERYTWSVRLEYYHQLGKIAGLPPAAGAALSQFSIAPSLTAGWLIVGFGFR
jgi:hypothetical protein